MSHQKAFIGALKPQQLANMLKATRKQPESNHKATSSWPNIPQHIPHTIPTNIPQSMPQQRALVGAR
jgi:hypothetical protein